MRIVFENPPLFDVIDAAFNVRGQPVIFCWGDIIYNPQRIKVTPELKAHEKVHCDRQAAHPETWWLRYVDDPAFRLAEEIPAHRAEFMAFRMRHRNLNQRGRMLNLIAERLSGPLYGGLLTKAEARQRILAS
jgi:hypothetical protein